ncbi:SAF domain-containing protein [Isoptericola sp. NPDC056578]|uniref:SAF domain-containing protein n=1 Tax=unclassified Isoptericola TaxID=2623355 RepID=UPI0036AA0BEA
MTTTTSAEATRSARRGSKADAEPPATPAVTSAKGRRRPMMIVGAAAVICFGSLLSVWAYSSTSDTQDVLAMRQTVERGQVITADDVMTVKISVDPALHPVAGDDLDTIVGKRAALDMPAGIAITAEQITDKPIPADGTSVVGISLTAGMLPAQQIRVGDHVRVVTTPGEGGEVSTSTAAEAVPAEVVGINDDDVTGNTILNVQVPADQSPDVAARAATGKVAIVLDTDQQEG